MPKYNFVHEKLELIRRKIQEGYGPEWIQTIHEIPNIARELYFEFLYKDAIYLSHLADKKDWNNCVHFIDAMLTEKYLLESYEG